MPNYMKHEGKLTTDGNGVIILYGMIEEHNPVDNNPSTDYALVYKMGSTTPAFETPLLQYVRGTEGQNARMVGDVLNKYTIGGQPNSILQTLKRTGKIYRVSVDQILVIMNSEHSFSLREWVKIQLESKQMTQSIASEPQVVGVVEESADGEVVDMQIVEETNQPLVRTVDEIEAAIEAYQEEIERLKTELETVKNTKKND